jgi:hypothetical protein
VVQDLTPKEDTLMSTISETMLRGLLANARTQLASNRRLLATFEAAGVSAALFQASVVAECEKHVAALEAKLAEVRS